MRKAILTKYAFTSGIVLVEGFIRDNRFIIGGTRFSHTQCHDHDLHTTSESALEDVAKRYERKRKSLLKQLDVLNRKYNECTNAIQSYQLREDASVKQTGARDRIPDSVGVCQ